MKMANSLISIIFSTACLLILLTKSNGFSLPTLKLSSGYEIPVVGIDVSGFQKDVAEKKMTQALSIGHRSFDGAFEYQNEKEIGRALKKWFAQGNKREDVFILSKMPIQGLRPNDISLYLNKTLSDLDLEYVDMYFLHAPTGCKRTKDLQVAYNPDGTVALDKTTDLVAVWKEMENQVKAGKAKSIGFSDFNKSQLIKIWENAEIKPAQLQLENNAYLQETEYVEFARSLGLVVSCYSPSGTKGDFGYGVNSQTNIRPELEDHPIVKQIADKYQKPTYEILTRYNRQRNLVVNTDNYEPKGMKDNLDMLKFTLGEEDMKLLKALDQYGDYRKYSRLGTREIEKHPEYQWPAFARKELSIYKSC